MTYLDEIKGTIGQKRFLKLDKLSNAVFSYKYGGLYSSVPLGQNSYVEDLIPKLLEESEFFEDLGLKISPIDAINIMYKCKLIKASTNIDTYRERTIGCNLYDEFDFFIPWDRRNDDYETLLEEYFERLRNQLSTNTLIVPIKSFKGNYYLIQSFFDELFKELGYPYIAFIFEDYIIQKHKEFGRLDESNYERAQRYFSSPSIGFSIHGSSLYCRWYSNMLLKPLVSLTKIAGFIYPGQVEFGGNLAEVMAPTYPVFLEKATTGCFMWDEDKKEPILKVPDGCLSRSFGNRSVTNMWLDIRNFKNIREFILSQKSIFEIFKNPWNRANYNDVVPTLDILSSATQSTDLGAKILSIYCCLEHIFVPKGIKKNNKEIIVENIHNLDPNLKEWFTELYEYRCDYSHKGYIKMNDRVLELIRYSITNTLLLLKLKLSNRTA